MMAEASSRILIVDDEETLAFFLRQSLLRELGHPIVDTASSGEEALEKIGAHAYDLVLADLRLPGMNGLELIGHIRQALPQARTILMTAYGSDAVKAEAHRLEVFRYLTKPFRLPDITATVREALEGLAVSSKDILVISDDRFEAVTRVLEALSREVGAQFILLADSLGQMITSVGNPLNIDLPTTTSLIAAGFATSFELMRYLGQREARNLNYFEGPDYDIYTSNVGENLFVTLFFTKGASFSRIGTVWLYTKRAVMQLQEMLPADGPQDDSLDLDSDFALDLGRALEEGFATQDTGADASAVPEVSSPPALAGRPVTPTWEQPVPPAAPRTVSAPPPAPARRPAAPVPEEPVPPAAPWTPPAPAARPAAPAWEQPVPSAVPRTASSPPARPTAPVPEEPVPPAAPWTPSAPEPEPAAAPGAADSSAPRRESPDTEEGLMGLEEALRRGLISPELHEQLTRPRRPGVR